ncbi:MAG: hypothetical protein PHR35_10880 [Kiritimatiellae bacterium]|nr:hypothetical protein [Kiritimatiellia bacterium]
MKRWSMAIAGLAGFIAMDAGRADTHYVSPDGGEVAPYTNGWPSAARDIQAAVNAAVESDTVLVNDGTYTLTNQITLSAVITLRSVNGRDLTFINGNYPAYTNRCLKVNNKAAVVNGFTISNGYFVIQSTADGEQGGGGVMLNNAGTLLNCIVEGNTSTNSTADENNVGGGGVFMSRGGVVSNCVIRGNKLLRKGRGGGVFQFAAPTGRLLDSQIVSNSVPSGKGGGGFAWQGEVRNCDFVGNSAYIGGGLSSYGSAIYGCRIYENSASYQGGGVSGTALGSVVNCIISNNSVNTASGVSGGGVYSDYGGTISNCQIVANSSLSQGGGMWVQGDDGTVARVMNCVIAGNRAVAVAGICGKNEAIIRNCLIYGNVASGACGGLNAVDMCRNGVGKIQNVTIAGNRCNTVGGGINLEGKSSSNLIYNSIIYGNVAVNTDYDDMYNQAVGSSNAYFYCCASTPLTPGQGNITGDPKFVDIASGNYRLRGSSGCVNAGANEDWMAGALDLDGELRMRGGIVDMGAYEYIPTGTVVLLR